MGLEIILFRYPAGLPTTPSVGMGSENEELFHEDILYGEDIDGNRHDAVDSDEGEQDTGSDHQPSPVAAKQKSGVDIAGKLKDELVIRFSCLPGELVGFRLAWQELRLPCHSVSSMRRRCQ